MNAIAVRKYLVKLSSASPKTFRKRLVKTYTSTDKLIKLAEASEPVLKDDSVSTLNSR